uniref:Integron gene cassette protein n=1 Tax=Macrostomum lignano TaxID=282301 RepID=A0A1I8FJ56_9PLAT
VTVVGVAFVTTVEEARLRRDRRPPSGSFSAAQERRNADDASATAQLTGEAAACGAACVQRKRRERGDADFQDWQGTLSRLFRRLWRGVRKSATSAGALSSGQDWLLGMEWLATLPAAGLKASG